MTKVLSELEIIAERIQNAWIPQKVKRYSYYEETGPHTGLLTIKETRQAPLTRISMHVLYASGEDGKAGHDIDEILRVNTIKEIYTLFLLSTGEQSLGRFSKEYRRYWNYRPQVSATEKRLLQLSDAPYIPVLINTTPLAKDPLILSDRNHYSNALGEHVEVLQFLYEEERLREETLLNEQDELGKVEEQHQQLEILIPYRHAYTPVMLLPRHGNEKAESIKRTWRELIPIPQKRDAKKPPLPF